MAGTLTISTLSDGTNSTSSTNCIQGSAKAWVNFFGDGSTSINASFNVSSVTFVSTGVYTVNMTNAMSDTNYSVFCGGNYATYTGGYLTYSGSGQVKTTSSFKVTGNSGANTVNNLTYCFVAVFR